MKNFIVTKIGNIVKFCIGGKLNQKICSSSTEANDLYRLGLEARENPTDENLKKIRAFLNEKTRVAMLAGLETDPDTGEVYLAGFNTPIPMTLVEVIKEYHDNNYPLDAILNFWKLLMINPDERVRTSLFDFITTHDFVLTDKGYMVVYKAVYRKNEVDNTLPEIISNRFLHVKKTWKESPKNYLVYKNEEGEYAITKAETAEKWNEKERGVEVLGNLADLFNSIFNTDNKVGEESTALYTDMHSRTMTIELGVPVKMERKECDSDPAQDCSYGLHCGATAYVERFANRGESIILVCLVNPAHVVAVPQYDHSKMRVAEYFPYAFATYTDGKIDIIDDPYFEDDYCAYEQAELEELVAKVQANQLPIETAIKAEAESRPMSELMKILESRLVDIG
jgi:hypothetical protein